MLATSTGLVALGAKVKQVLAFLQDGLEKELATNTLQRQVAALSSILGARSGGSLAAHAHIRRFLRRVALLNPSLVHRFPNWDLNSIGDTHKVTI